MNHGSLALYAGNHIIPFFRCQAFWANSNCFPFVFPVFFFSRVLDKGAAE